MVEEKTDTRAMATVIIWGQSGQRSYTQRDASEGQYGCLIVPVGWSVECRETSRLNACLVVLELGTPRPIVLGGTSLRNGATI